MSRIGLGWDLHRLVDGRPMRLCGIDIAFERGPLGHSDGDVGLHAICDALLSAIGAGDIGSHFPDDDPQYAGADSSDLLRRVVEILTAAGFQIGNVDVTLIAERPKLAPYFAAMRSRLAALMAIDERDVSIKAKTAEGVGAIGHGEAVSAIAVALVERIDTRE